MKTFAKILTVSFVQWANNYIVSPENVHCALTVRNWSAEKHTVDHKSVISSESKLILLYLKNNFYVNFKFQDDKKYHSVMCLQWKLNFSICMLKTITELAAKISNKRKETTLDI